MERGEEIEISKKEEEVNLTGVVIHRAPNGLWGPAVEYTRVDSLGKMWVGNGEYETQVNYCPFSGVKAPVQMRYNMLKRVDGTMYKEYIND